MSSYNRNQIITIVVPAVLISFGTVVVGLRFWARRYKNQKWNIDDFLCLACLMVTYLHFASTLVATVKGYGKPIAQVPPQNLDIIFKFLAASSQTCYTAFALIQLSILAFYIRVFTVIRWLRYTCFVLMGLVLAWWISAIVVLNTACIPLRKFWKPSIPGTCIDMKSFSDGNSLSHIALDVLIIAVILPVIFNLKTKLADKITVCVALMMAACATLCAVIRFIYTRVDAYNTDITGQNWKGSVLNLVENALAVICSSLPVLAFLFARVSNNGLGKCVGRMSKKSSSSNQNLFRIMASNTIGGRRNQVSDEKTESMQSIV